MTDTNVNSCTALLTLPEMLRHEGALVVREATSWYTFNAYWEILRAITSPGNVPKER